LICKWCQVTFGQYKGMKRTGFANIGVCPQCEEKRNSVPTPVEPA
jgi:hypothetical protein